MSHLLLWISSGVWGRLIMQEFVFSCIFQFAESGDLEGATDCLGHAPPDS